MGLFTDGFKLLKKASEPLYKTPKSIQETIEIMAVAENGIFEVSKNKYSKCYRFQDINYTTATEDEQIGIFERYCKFLNSLDCNYKITINNKNKNMDELRDKVLIAEKNDGFNNYRRIYNDIIEEKIIEGRQGIEQERYLTITIERKNFEEAKAQFATLEATIHKAFIELGAEIVPLNGNERLKVLYDYYHLGDEGSFDFDIKKAKKVGADFRNDLCNGMVKYFPDHFEDESKFCKALFIKKYPSSLSDRFINEITSLPVHSISEFEQTLEDDYDEETDVEEEQTSISKEDEAILKEGGVIGIIEIPGLDIRYPVMEGTTSKVLNAGIGHIEETAGIGESGNCVLCGHNGSRYGTFFTPLSQISIGEEVMITDKNGLKHIYEVTEPEVVNPYDNSIKTQGDEKELTLFTCSQKGTMRFVVRCIYKEAVMDE